MPDGDTSTIELTPFEEKAVAKVGVEIPNAAGGLQDALDVDPEEWHHGDTVHLVMKCSVRKVRFDPITRNRDTERLFVNLDVDELLRRVHVLHVVEASPIEGELVAEVLEETRERVRKAKDAEKGQTNLLDGEDEGGDPGQAGSPADLEG